MIQHADVTRWARLAATTSFMIRTLALLSGPATAMQAQGVRYAPAAGAVVKLSSGKIQGAEPAPGVYAFLGIPYAKAPIGALRWQPPQPYGPLQDSGSEPRQAVAHGTPCAQQHFGWNTYAADHGSEDCLFLNVWAPARGAHLPVMVYIHGGSNTAGSASEELSNGLALVPRGVLLVTFDYRLGIFGFLRTPELDAASLYHGSGNYGLLDQIAVLQWVHNNIAAFGGDPANITVFGQSAGAVDTGLLMTSPLARGLFARALEESGQVLGLMPTATREQSEEAWAPVARALGQTPETMRSASTEDVLRAELAAPKPPPEEFWGHRGASVDGHVLPDLPARIFAQGREAPIPLLIGSNVQEIVPNSQTAAQTDALIVHAVGEAKAPALEAMYAAPPRNSLEGNAGARFQTDRDFRCPVLQVATWHARHGFPTFVYQFDRSAGSPEPARHSSELRFVFGFPSRKPPASTGSQHHGPTADDVQVENTLEGYWVSFARSGKPNVSPGSPLWPRFQPDSGNYLHFTSTSITPLAANNLGGSPCSVLNASASTLAQ